jgi:lysophospholipase L1-like esterase
MKTCIQIIILTYLAACHIIDVAVAKTLVEGLQGGRTVLAFGDSLTWGLVVSPPPFLTSMHPYAWKLQELINVQTKNTTYVIPSGINGERTPEMVFRFPLMMEVAKPTVVIILGGTNDLVHRFTGAQILQNLETMHTQALKSSVQRGHAVYTVALTMPQCVWHVDQNTRLTVNKGLKAMVNRCKDRMMLIDLEDGLDMRKLENDRYWSVDKVHLSAKGYDRVGELIYDTLAKFNVSENPSIEYSC